LKFLERHSVLVGYSDLYTVTIAGRREARRHADAGGYSYPKGLRMAGVAIKDTRHMIACASVVAGLERRYPGHRVIGERELQREESEQGRWLASVNIRHRGRTRSHFPDIVIWPPPTPDAPAPLPVAVEVELTMRSKGELVEILRAWGRCRYIEAALYYAASTKLEEKLFDTVDALRVWDMVVVNQLSEIVDSIPGFDLPR